MYDVENSIEHEGFDPRDASSISRDASDFNASLNIEIGVLPYGEFVIHAAPPYSDTSDDHSWHMFVEYQISFNAYGDYAIWIEYAAAEPRPCDIHWDGVLVARGAMSNMTGGWDEDFQRWQKQKAISAAPGTHSLRISRDRYAIPHIRTIALVPLR